MADLHKFGGEKGGVGKSFVARTVAAYCLHHQLPFVAFDTDRSNPDLMRIYGKKIDVKFGIFSEGTKFEDSANSIYETAIEQRVLCNLPAQVMPAIKGWVENNDLLALAQQDGVRFILWFVLDGGFDSLQLLSRSLRYFKGAITHVVIKNFGTGGDDWEPFLSDEALQQQIVEYGARVIDFPRFMGNSTRNTLDRENLTFAEALTYKGFSSLEKQRVRKFLKESYRSLEKANVL
ncbi:MAG: hypothetical protein AAF329_05775 [Cyanobacteria bacterium P01_A01_bin.17]